MMFGEQVLVFLLILSIAAEGQVASPNQDEQDYYWKDYTGLPADALPGGRDRDGNITYIGQTIYDYQTLVPGEIDPTTKTLFYAISKKQKTTTNHIKILCARNHKNYEWFNTTISNVRFLTHKHLVSGGYSGGYPHLIGRIEWKEKVIVGKIALTPSDDWFAFDADGAAQYVKSNFQVLSYNPNSNNSKVIDTRFKSGCGNTVYNIHFGN